MSAARRVAIAVLAPASVLCLLSLTWSCRRELQTPAEKAAQAPRQPGIPQPNRLPPPRPPFVGATLYLGSDGPHIVVVAAKANRFRFADEAIRTWHYTPALTWEAPLAADGTPGTWTDGPPLRPKDGWDGRGLCVVQCGSDRLTAIQRGTPSPYSSAALPFCDLIVERDGQPYASDAVRIPWYGVGRVTEGHRSVPEPVAYGLSDPSALIASGRLWLASAAHRDDVLLDSAKWDDPRKLAWDRTHRFGRGHGPSIVARETGALLLAYVEHPRPERDTDYGRGPIALHHSADGEKWEALPSPAPGREAHDLALALDPAQGLCLLYTAAEETGRPLMALRSADFGRTWGEPVMLSEPTTYASQPKALCHGGSLYVVFRQTTPPLPTKHGHSREGDPLGIYTLVLDPAALLAPEASAAPSTAH